MVGLLELLGPRGLDAKARAKLVRHQDKRYDVHRLLKLGQFETYQGFQAKPVFDCDWVVAFIGHGGRYARLIGVYRVLDREPPGSRTLPPDFLYPDMKVSASFYYNLERDEHFDDLASRVVIEWGASARAWHQRLCDKEVVEILPRGYVRDFPGYLDFILDYDELVTIVTHPMANREWHRMLGGVAGVYIISDRATGNQYVGSAAGSQGLLGRWATYARVPHGGNRQLRALIDRDPAYAKNFSFSILRTLEKTLTRQEVFAYEVLLKRKLGTRAFGLNSN